MTSCACPTSRLTSVQFTHGVVMQRCQAHELATWTVDGRRADARTVRGRLKDVFVESRGQRRTAAPARTPRVAQPAVPAHPAGAVAAMAQAPDDDLLTALLNARGLTGSWATA